MGEWGNEPTTSTVDMDRNVDTGLGLILVKNMGDFLYWFVMASVGTAPVASG